MTVPEPYGGAGDELRERVAELWDAIVPYADRITALEAEVEAWSVEAVEHAGEVKRQRGVITALEARNRALEEAIHRHKAGHDALGEFCSICHEAHDA